MFLCVLRDVLLSEDLSLPIRAESGLVGALVTSPTLTCEHVINGQHSLLIVRSSTEGAAPSQPGSFNGEREEK